MDKAKLIFGLTIVLSMIIAGCTGPKAPPPDIQPVDDQMAGARDDYNTKVSALNKMINNLKEQSRPANVTMDEYRSWLDDYDKLIAITEQRFNDTIAAGERYAEYLDNESVEYKRIISDREKFGQDIKAQRSNYNILERSYDTRLEKQAATDDYIDKSNIADSRFNDLLEYTRSTSPANIGEYRQFIDGFKQRSIDYEYSANQAIDAGIKLQQYYDPESSEYVEISDREKVYRNNIKTCWETYNSYQSNYEKNAAVMGSYATNKEIQDIYNDYVAKLNRATASKKELDEQKNPMDILSKLDKEWIQGYGQKVAAFVSDCNAAIEAGRKLQKYLDPEGGDFENIAKNEQAMVDSMNKYQEDYRKIVATYNNMHPLDPVE
ncbi:hypothetical protein CUJ83_03975 [Methanocella sp. CWC-04]|uniref:Uncharacterized protein n=1 Tax=Methanooceanicella nereidis TaxID=2052831 RepID=A0AAP2RAU3_9EURY|nr:hypothetical protein [Methanocella sp. CWC-04]MCD1294151.1 hypothetical protein [Methanocella sp. CWC-04]